MKNLLLKHLFYQHKNIVHSEKNEEIKDLFYEDLIVKISEYSRALPDFIVEKFSSNKLEVIEIKPEMALKNQSVKNKLELVKENLEKMNYDYRIISNKDIDKIKKELGEDFKIRVNEFRE